MIRTPTLGAPGIYREAVDTPVRSLTGVRMDVAAFVGVAPRGPAREPLKASPWPVRSSLSKPRERRSVPVPVESWTEYVRHYGGFSGPGLLPYAVHAFFRQGGRRAYVVRIVHDYGDVRDREGRASAPVTGLLAEGVRGLPLRAAAAGSAGNDVRARVAWEIEDLGFRGVLSGGLALEPTAVVVAGDLIRMETAGGSRRFLRVESVRDDDLAGSDVRVAVPATELDVDPVSVDRVRMELTVEGSGGVETHDDLGLSPGHPRWVGRVLTETSTLVRADRRWLERELRPVSARLRPPPPGRPFRGGGPGRPARGSLPGVVVRGDGVWLEARNEGRWGDRLRASVSLREDPLDVRGALDGKAVPVPPRSPVPRGARLVFRNGGASPEVRTVVDVVEDWLPDAPERVRWLILDAAPSETPEAVYQLEGSVRIRETPAPGGDGTRRVERFDRLGLAPTHPRWIHGVLRRESRLVRPHEDWSSAPLEVTPDMLDGGALESGPFRGGQDRYRDIVHGDFFDDEWSPGGEDPGEGIHALGAIGEVSLLVVPDLYSPEPLSPIEEVTAAPSLSGPSFAPCVRPLASPAQAEPTSDLEGLRLDPVDPTDFASILGLQMRVAEFARRQRSFVALLDVPPGLRPAKVSDWRRRFGTAFAAAYHPWTEVALPEDGRSDPVRVNPSGVAAGIIARVERSSGVHYGPANVTARDVVRLSEDISPRQHDLLHTRGINVFLTAPGGAVLTGARTLSRDPAYRQLSVRRLVTMLARTLEVEMAWTAFEPNGRALRGQVTHLLTSFLRRLHRANAFVGATEEDAFFVRCDETLNSPRVVDSGRLLAEVGVAPAEPTEYLVLRIARDSDGVVRAEG